MANQIQSCFERYEKKYMLTPAQLRVMLTGMKAHMVPDQYGKYTICNIYYDTPDWRLIRASLEKPVYKEKLRVRSYGVAAPDGKAFVEIKKKFDGVVYKRRITAPAPLVEPLLGPDQVLMEIKIPGTCPLWLSHLLDRAGARPVSFSKYGTCYQQHILPRIRAEQQNHQNNHHRQEEIRCA